MIPDTSGLVRKIDCNAKIAEIEGRILKISGVATTTALTTVENKIRDVSNLVKRTDYNTKINKFEKKITDHIDDKHITTSEVIKLTKEIFAARLAQTKLATKSDIASFVNKTDFDEKLIDLNKKVTSSKTKHLLVENDF